MLKLSNCFWHTQTLMSTRRAVVDKLPLHLVVNMAVCLSFVCWKILVSISHWGITMNASPHGAQILEDDERCKECETTPKVEKIDERNGANPRLKKTQDFVTIPWTTPPLSTTSLLQVSLTLYWRKSDQLFCALRTLAPMDVWVVSQEPQQGCLLFHLLGVDGLQHFMTTCSFSSHE